MSSSLRLRLAVWYASLLAIILALTLVLSYAFHSTSHYEDVDRFLVGTNAHVLGHVKAELGAGTLGPGATIPPVDEFASPDIYVRLYDVDGGLVASSSNAGRKPEADPRQVSTLPALSTGEAVLSSLVRPMVNLGRPSVVPEGGFLLVTTPQGNRTRLYAVPVTVDGVTRGYVEAGDSLDWLDQSMARLRWILAATAVMGVLSALLGGWAIAGRALRPVSAMAGTARAIALSRGFSRRIPSFGRHDELGQLATTFNDMLASLDEAYRAQQRFIADASHELRAPLTAIQGNLELLERTDRMGDQERAETLSYLRKEAHRMGRLVADLLVLARADAGQGIQLRRVELDRLLFEVFQGARRMAPDRKLSLKDLEQVELQGDPDRLKQLLLILVDNALKYTPESGEVSLALHVESGAATIVVADTGIGIPPEDLPHIFERFYRADRARPRDRGGTGLGLSIAAWIAERHGGQIDVASRVGGGSTFTLRLPVDDRLPKRGSL